ncbi:TetR/AcrR family transcriptional regulator [Streptomyces albireticuli]|uniref:TetR family transcriptional regulator n=1 Tax=Streptomyces albireticuli TaxID=1940 RepID=A0A2A2DD95_9ACTN|nr:TetR/AcrR family transcriptional regulator [Streptomyces albireticuli]MCD9144978.1 TetR family transcriptional regulator [Streptomyces albireticuli]MCD9164404.1 TetR family transcriptional regulator [Streptomyces albireticuli]MCD9194115.1 TetR family transcriptional regulator [Streptomyces albireticuli]PAU49407.1 TetR family transcriptional regulator [Streptomyces albireticuli]
MARNPERRTALVDAAIEVLAREGARGLTFRAVDTQAGVPVGTASNYFASRDDLFTQAGSRIHVRMAPDPAQVDEAMRPAPTRELVVELMRWLVRRMTAERTGYLAMLELRLEATRRPALQAELNRAVRAALDENVRFHLDAGLPGDEDTVLVLYLAMTGLLVEYFTLPEMLSDRDLDALVETVVTRVLPPE